MTTGVIWRIGIPGFHELDQHLEAPLLPGVRIMVFASCSFLSFSPFFSCFASFLFLLFNSSCLLLLLLLLLLFPPFFLIFAQHRFYGRCCVCCFFLCFCSYVLFGRIAFSCACCLRTPRRFVLQLLCFICCQPPCCQICRSIHTLCSAFAYYVLMLGRGLRLGGLVWCLILCLVKVIPYCINLFFSWHLVLLNVHSGGVWEIVVLVFLFRVVPLPDVCFSFFLWKMVLFRGALI